MLSAEFRPHVETFAQNIGDYKSNLKTGFVKLTSLGHSNLDDVDDFLNDDPDFKLIMRKVVLWLTIKIAAPI